MAKAREKQRRRSDGAPVERAGGRPQWPYAVALAVAAAWAASFFLRGGGGGGGDGQPPATPRKSSGRGGLHGNHRIFADDGGPAFVDPSKLSQKKGLDMFWIDPPKRALSEQKYLAAKQKARARFMDGIERREMNGTSLQAQLSCIPSRDGRWDAFNAMSAAELVPRFSKTGYQVVKIPAKTYKEMRKFADKSVSAAVPDMYIKGYRQAMSGVSGVESAGAWKESNGIIFREPYAPLYFPQPRSHAKDLVGLVTPIAEKFAGVPLEVTAHHGFRYYLRNNWMPLHSDTVDSRIIGVNMHIHSHYDNASEPWLFEIYNHETDTIDAVPLEEGEMVVYEATGNIHGRSAPLRGDFHGSVFLHFAPVRWPYSFEDVTAQVPPGWDAPGTCDSRDGPPESQWFALGAGQLMRKIAY